MYRPYQVEQNFRKIRGHLSNLHVSFNQMGWFYCAQIVMHGSYLRNCLCFWAAYCLYRFVFFGWFCIDSWFLSSFFPILGWFLKKKKNEETISDFWKILGPAHQLMSHPESYLRNFGDYWIILSEFVFFFLGFLVWFFGCVF